MFTLKEYTYFVNGMHCASCEIIIEKKLLEFKEIKSVDAKTEKGEVLIEYVGEKPSLNQLNKCFREEKYIFSDKPILFSKKGFMRSVLTAIILIGAFLLLNRLGFSSIANINSSSSLISFFIFGLIAGLSSCAALVGGIVLSMSKQWLQYYSDKDSVYEKLKPHLMFNIGRIVSYAVFGAVLGIIGSQLKISLTFTSLLIIVVSLAMAFFGAQMLGIKAIKRFQASAPKFISRYIANEENFKGRKMPFIMGALTFFLPCGFTVSAQGVALLSASPVQSSLIMLAFALGTSFPLLGIGLSAIKFSKPELTLQFSRIAGIMILFFAVFNINSQLAVLGFKNLADLDLFRANAITYNERDLPEIINGKQVIKMDEMSYGYKPNNFKVRANIPVRWEITDKGTSGCANAIISNSLFPDQISLKPGQISVKEFIPQKPGRYKFSCWMGMISGAIEVI